MITTIKKPISSRRSRTTKVKCLQSLTHSWHTVLLNRHLSMTSKKNWNDRKESRNTTSTKSKSREKSTCRRDSKKIRSNAHNSKRLSTQPKPNQLNSQSNSP